MQNSTSVWGTPPHSHLVTVPMGTLATSMNPSTGQHTQAELSHSPLTSYDVSSNF